jgi:DNA (cytosine-5)-methyltransferase 3A
MKVLSLFDGISCGRLALERAGIPVEKYYASEIDKYAIQVAQKNYPDTIQVGDVNKLNYLELLDVDMIIGGSPCQDLSIAKQNRQGLRGERSGLFWKYVEALEVIHPRWFLLENVASMRNEDRDAITETLRKLYPETECIMINSALVSAQQRKRYYWTNWHVEQPHDKGILLKDILESGQVIRDGKSHAVISSVGRTTEREYFKKNQGELVAVPCAMRTREDELGKFKRVETKDDGKANSLTSVQTDSMVAEPVKSTNKFQTINAVNPDKSDCLIAGYYKAPFNQSTTGVMISAPERIGELNGLSKAQGNRIYSVRGKSVCLNANGGGGGAKTGLYKVDLPDGDYIIRKLTPVECARLQTMPDHWCDGISATQQYKCLGNGWTVDVIAHIFKQLPREESECIEQNTSL